MIGAKARIVASCVAALAVTAQALAEKTTVEFANGATRPHSVALLPVDSTVNRAKVVDTDSLVDDGLKYGSLFNARVKTLLESKGYAVEVVDTDRINSDPQLQEYVVEATRGFKDMMSRRSSRAEFTTPVHRRRCSRRSSASTRSRSRR